MTRPRAQGPCKCGANGPKKGDKASLNGLQREGVEERRQELGRGALGPRTEGAKAQRRAAEEGRRDPSC